MGLLFATLAVRYNRDLPARFARTEKHMPEQYFALDSRPNLALPAADPQAEALNKKLMAEAPAVFAMLSPCGKSLYYPKQGLLLQAEEAAQSRYNATVGIALDDDGKPMHYRGLARMLNLAASRCVPYASSYGLAPLRQLWQEQLCEKNPALGALGALGCRGESAESKNIQGTGVQLSLPVVTGGITHGLWIALQMFLGRGEALLLPKLFWPNYRLIAEGNCGARLKHYNTFCAGGLDLEAIRAELQAPGEKKVLLFNFPHNPTGYSPRKVEVGRLRELLRKAAEAGRHIVVICDDAYWGLCYEAETERQSLFAFVAGLHPNIVAVKLDGATKEDFAWGLRVGFITFGHTTRAGGKVLEEKAGAAVRLSTSNSSRLSQELLLETYREPATNRERTQLQAVLQARYRALRQCLASERAKNEWCRILKPLPFNSGYFMTFEMPSAPFGADQLRKYLLQRYDIGLIALQDKYLRFAFSAVAEKDIPHVVETLHLAYAELAEQVKS